MPQTSDQPSTPDLPPPADDGRTEPENTPADPDAEQTAKGAAAASGVSLGCLLLAAFPAFGLIALIIFLIVLNAVNP